MTRFAISPRVRRHHKRRRVPDPLRVGCPRRPRATVPRVLRRGDPELDSQSALDLEGRGPGGVRARDPRVPRDLRLSTLLVLSLVTGWTNPPGPRSIPGPPRAPGPDRDRLVLRGPGGAIRPFGSSSTSIGSSPGRSRVRAALRSRRQVWSAARANRTPVAQVPVLLGVSRVAATVAHGGRDLRQPEAVERGS